MDSHADVEQEKQEQETQKQEKPKQPQKQQPKQSQQGEQASGGTLSKTEGEPAVGMDFMGTMVRLCAKVWRDKSRGAALAAFDETIAVQQEDVREEDEEEREKERLRKIRILRREAKEKEERDKAKAKREAESAEAGGVVPTDPPEETKGAAEAAEVAEDGDGSAIPEAGQLSA
jgi:hypothetical protein